MITVISALFFASWVLWKLVNRWNRQAPLRRIAGPPSPSLLTGHMGQVYSQQGWKFHADLAANYGKVVKLDGILGDAHLYVSDTRALHNILVKDQHIFEESSHFIQQNRLIFGMGLASTLGDHHKRQRKLLNPVFSSSHMRYMMPTFYRISHQLRDVLVRMTKGCSAEVDMMDWMTRAALEIIGQGGLGYSFDSLNDKIENSYGNAAKTLWPTINSPPIMIIGQFLPWAVKVGNAAFRRAIAEAIPEKTIRQLVNIVNIMDTTAKEVFEIKKTALNKGDEAMLAQIGEGKDIMSILLKANLAASEEDSLTESELLAQMNVLIFAAMDTTSSALARILHLLSEHVEVQEKLRAELTEAAAKGALDFDNLNGLPYLDAVCRETLRLYPPVPYVNRTTRQDVVLPLGTPITGVDGTEISKITIPRNTGIIVSIIAVNRDPGIWGPDVMEWKPERWLSTLPASVTDARIPGIYSNTLTFLGGGRSCIGFKFSQLEMKVILASLIPAIRFSASKKRIGWVMGGLTGPVLEGTSQPSMPLILTPVKSERNVQ